MAIVIALLAVRIAYQHYHAVRLEFEPAAIADISRHPERLNIPQLQQITIIDDLNVQLAAWYVPSRNRAAVVLATGTNADRSSMLPEIKILSDAGFGVLAFDWPGNGASGGSAPHWDINQRHALTAALDWLTHRSDVDTDKVGGLGFSIGGYLLTQVAAMDTRLSAVVLEATATDFEEYIRWRERKWGVLSELPAMFALHSSQMPYTEARPIDVIAKIAPRAVLIIGGEFDPGVSATMTKSLYAAAQPPKSLWIVPGAFHGGYAQIVSQQYPSHLVEFLTTYLKPEPG